MSQLPVDCFIEIFECLEEDKITLHSCLLVNRLWCGVSVRILWTSVWNYDTLLACLSNESKEILYENEIINQTPTSKPLLFNYIAFIKILDIDNIIKNLLENDTINFCYKEYIILHEIYKLLNQISSLRELHFYSIESIPDIMPTFYPGTRDCLKYLSKLSCHSIIHSEFFYQLSQICHNIQSLKIRFEDIISKGISELISAQKNLKYLNMYQLRVFNEDLEYIIPSLTKHSNTLVKLYIDEFEPSLLSFIAKFTNLQELVLSYCYGNADEVFKTLQYVNLPRLQILNFKYKHPRFELLTKFLDNNGKKLKELHVNLNYVVNDNKLWNLVTASKFYPNLRRILIKNDEFSTLKNLFYKSQYLESIRVWSHDEYLDTKKLFEILTKYSPKNFHELKLYLSN